jgi:3-hydroxyisobutyrate dehydrogenase
MHVGIAGLGRMGGNMALRLRETGNDVTVWNRTADKLRPALEAGCKAVESPKAVADAAEAIITILTNKESIANVYEGANGILAGDIKGKLIIEMSTVQPETEIALAGKVRAQGATFLECPVGGTTGPARQGKLLGVAGGTQADFDRAKPLLDQMCRRADLVGPVGSGSAMKLALNLPLLVYYQALGEACTIVDRFGVDKKWMMEFLSETSGGPNVLKNRGPAIAGVFAGKDPGPATIDIDGMVKDLRTMTAEAAVSGATLPVTEAAIAVYEQARKEGWGAKDVVFAPSYWAKHRKGR